MQQEVKWKDIVLPFIGIAVISLIVTFLTKSSALWKKFTVQEGLDFYTDSTGNIKPVPLGAVLNATGDGYDPVTMTTQFASNIPKSTHPNSDTLIHYDINNFDITYHSLDLKQYIDDDNILDKDGKLDTTKMADLFPQVRMAGVKKVPTYADSILFSKLNRETLADLKNRESNTKQQANPTFANPTYDANIFNQVYSNKDPIARDVMYQDVTPSFPSFPSPSK